MTSSNDFAAGSRLRSAQWYAGDDRNAYIHRAWMRRGCPGKRSLAVPYRNREYRVGPNPCNAHLTEVTAPVKDSVYEAGVWRWRRSGRHPLRRAVHCPSRPSSGAGVPSL